MGKLALAQLILQFGEFKLLEGWPKQLQYWLQALENAGALSEMRYE